MNDPNIRTAANMQFVGGLFIGALTGWAVAGWFDLSEAVGAGVGALVGYLLAVLLLSVYGGRSTR